VSSSDLTFFAIIALLGTNQAVMRIPWLHRQAGAFWAMQAVNACAGLFVLFYGLPGFEHVPAVQYVVGLLFLFHGADALRSRVKQGSKKREEARARKEAVAEMLRERAQG